MSRIADPTERDHQRIAKYERAQRTFNRMALPRSLEPHEGRLKCAALALQYEIQV